MNASLLVLVLPALLADSGAPPAVVTATVTATVTVTATPGPSVTPTPTPPRPAATESPTDVGSVGIHVRLQRLPVGSQLTTPAPLVVFLDDAPDGSGPALPKGPFSIEQRKKTFEPSLLIVPVGATVNFPNKDRVLHNVYSGSEPRKFHLGLYPAGESRDVDFHQAGIVQVFCNIHPQMAATILVVSNGFFAHPDDDGNVRFEGVPAGRWHVTTWFPYGQSRRDVVNVPAGGKATLEVPVVEIADPRRHVREDGTPYGGY